MPQVYRYRRRMGIRRAVSSAIGCAVIAAAATLGAGCGANGHAAPAKAPDNAAPPPVTESPPPPETDAVPILARAAPGTTRS
jgi:hypothetical protein